MPKNGSVAAYWWNEEPNFGDAMTPVLLSRLFNIDVTWAPLGQADLTAAGSVIQWITPARQDPRNPVHVWGSGYIFPDEPAPVPGTAVYHAVRGPRSAALSGLAAGTTYGDPGLLASHVFDRSPRAGRRIGIVPHLSHRCNPVIDDLARSNGLIVIDVTADPVSVISLISSCDFIFSSSLHGLVIADSFRIPNLWVDIAPSPFGGRWKFDDYYAVFSLQPAPVTLAQDLDIGRYVDIVAAGYTRPGLDDITEALFNAFPW
jgi:pyruvyltransferase